FLANTLPLRSDLSGNPTFREALRRVRATALGAYANQAVPFEKLVDVVQPERSQSHSPLVQVACTMQNLPPLPATFGSLAVQQIEVDPGLARFDLALLLNESAGEAQGTLEYRTDLFDAATVAR